MIRAARMPDAASAPAPTAVVGKPRHIAIIMDGNGRWAKAHGLPRTAGHKRGVDALRGVMDACREHGVRYLTIYAFSAENWKRPAEEVGELMQLLKHYLNREIKTLQKNRVRLRFIGNAEQLAPDIRTLTQDAETATSGNNDFHLTVGLSYGAKQELAQAMRELAREVSEGKLDADTIDESAIERRLYTHELPEPDLLIRTGGEHRLSNFLLWQSAYTELYFTPVLWPDFSPIHLEEAIHDFAKRERRYGNAV